MKWVKFFLVLFIGYLVGQYNSDPPQSKACQAINHQGIILRNPARGDLMYVEPDGEVYVDCPDGSQFRVCMPKKKPWDSSND